MSTSLKISVDAEKTKLNFSIPKDVADEFDLYVLAAQEQNDKATKNDVLAAILEYHIGKDRAFKKWVKDRDSSGSSQAPESPSNL